MYTQCFNYFNYSGSIKVPAILQYAKKLSRFLTDVFEIKDKEKDKEKEKQTMSAKIALEG